MSGCSAPWSLTDSERMLLLKGAVPDCFSGCSKDRRSCLGPFPQGIITKKLAQYFPGLDWCWSGPRPLGRCAYQDGTLEPVLMGRRTLSTFIYSAMLWHNVSYNILPRYWKIYLLQKKGWQCYLPMLFVTSSACELNLPLSTSFLRALIQDSGLVEKVSWE